MWSLQLHTHETQLIIQRTFKVKWWSKFDEESKLSQHMVQQWLSAKGHLKSNIADIKAQSTFLSQKSTAQSLLAGAKSEDEYFQIMHQLLASRPTSSAASSSSSGEPQPIISLGDDNEDDCFDISPL